MAEVTGLQGTKRATRARVRRRSSTKAQAIPLRLPICPLSQPCRLLMCAPPHALQGGRLDPLPKKPSGAPPGPPRSQGQPPVARKSLETRPPVRVGACMCVRVYVCECVRAYVCMSVCVRAYVCVRTGHISNKGLHVGSTSTCSCSSGLREDAQHWAAAVSNCNPVLRGAAVPPPPPRVECCQAPAPRTG